MDAPSKDAADRLRSRKAIPKPVPAYLPSAGSPLTVPKDLYDAVQKAPRTLVQDFVIPIRSGKAWKAPAGSIIRISTPEGPQVGEFPRSRERFMCMCVCVCVNNNVNQEIKTIKAT